jgi:hypothetical protein
MIVPRGHDERKTFDITPIELFLDAVLPMRFVENQKGTSRRSRQKPPYGCAD